jgi:hypothetical protein
MINVRLREGRRCHRGLELQNRAERSARDPRCKIRNVAGPCVPGLADCISSTAGHPTPTFALAPRSRLPGVRLIYGQVIYLQAQLAVPATLGDPDCLFPIRMARSPRLPQDWPATNIAVPGIDPGEHVVGADGLRGFCSRRMQRDDPALGAEALTVHHCNGGLLRGASSGATSCRTRTHDRLMSPDYVNPLCESAEQRR